jgi:hypothetical protein
MQAGTPDATMASPTDFSHPSTKGLYLRWLERPPDQEALEFP